MKCKSCDKYVYPALKRCINCGYPTWKPVVIYPDSDYYKKIENERIERELEQIYKTETFKRRGVEKGA